MSPRHRESLSPKDRTLLVLGKPGARVGLEPAWVPVSRPALRALMLQGKAHTTEVLGSGSCGKTSLGLFLLQEFAASNHRCVFVDVDLAARSWLCSGILTPPLERLTFLCPQDPKEADQMVRFCLAGDRFDVVFVDSLGHTSDDGFTQPFLSSWCQRAERSLVQLVVMNPGTTRREDVGLQRQWYPTSRHPDVQRTHAKMTRSIWVEQRGRLWLQERVLYL